jgi:hypothetical protein
MYIGYILGPCHMLKWLVAFLSQQRHEFDPNPAHVGFVVDKVALGQVSSVSMTPPQLHTHISFDNHPRYVLLLQLLTSPLNKALLI